MNTIKYTALVLTFPLVVFALLTAVPPLAFSYWVRRLLWPEAVRQEWKKAIHQVYQDQLTAG